MSDILNEIQESISEKKRNSILAKLVISIFVFGVIFVIYLGISSWYDNNKSEQIQSDGATLTQIVNSINYTKNKSKTVEAQKEFEEKNKLKIEKLEKLGESGNSIYSALADIYLATISLMNGNHTKAVYYYQRISKNTNYDEAIREYTKLIEINTKLQFNRSEVYETSQKQIHEYFTPYITESKKINHDIVHKKSFSNAMAITGIALESEVKKFENSAIYLNALNQYEGNNENVILIRDLLEIYIKQNERQ